MRELPFYATLVASVPTNGGSIRLYYKDRRWYIAWPDHVDFVSTARAHQWLICHNKTKALNKYFPLKEA